MVKGIPAASVIAGEVAERAMVADVLASVGWRTARPTDRPDLVLTAAIDGERPATAEIGRLRSSVVTADVPLVAWTCKPAGPLLRQGFDDVLPRPCSPDLLHAMLARWQPVDPSSTLERLAAALGQSELQVLTLRLHALLHRTLASLANAPDLADAHRIAGVAGMLGFPELGEAWLAIAERRLGSTAAAARIASRLALAALARHQVSVAAASGNNVASRSAHDA